MRRRAPLAGGPGAAPSTAVTAAPEGKRFDLRQVVGSTDPYPFYARWRERDPVHHIATGPALPDAWILFRHADVEAALKSGAVARPPESRGLPEPIDAVIRRWMVVAGAERHAALRRIMGRAFTPAALAGLRPAIEQSAERLAARLITGAVVDFAATFAVPLPLAVIAEILGVPPHERPDLLAWTKGVAPMVELTPGAGEVKLAMRAFAGLGEHLDRAVAARRAEPRDDLLTSMMQAADEEGMEAADVVANAIFLVIAGYETTASTLTTGLYHLLRRPAAWHRLLAEPALAGPAAAELLRFDAPVQVLYRQVREPLMVGEREIPAGVDLLAMLGSANRDPAAYERPDELILDRVGPRPLSFAAGRHYCLGAALARYEVEAALIALATVVPDLELAGPPRWRRGTVLRGIEHLPVKVG